MPASIKLQQQYGDDLQVLFVESQGADIKTAEAFAWRQKWMGTRAMWTLEPPLRVEGNTLPKFALLDNEGRLVMSGNPLDMKKKIDETIADQVKKAKNPPSNTPVKLAKAWSSFAKGDIGAAITECDKVGAADASVADAAKAMHTEISNRTNARIARGKWLIDNGYPSEASDLFVELGKSVKGSTEFNDKIAAETKRLSPSEKDGGPEAEAAKQLAPLVQKMSKEKPFEDANVKALGRIAEKYSGTKSAARAEHLAELAKIKF